MSSRALARRIGPDLTAAPGTWFADLLDALSQWWDGMGPGGQGGVLVAGFALLALGGALLLAPELLLAPGIIAIGGAAQLGQATALAGGLILTMAAAGHAAPNPGSGGGGGQGSPPGSNDT